MKIENRNARFLPEPHPEAMNALALTAPKAIRNLLNELVRRRASIALCPDDNPENILTSRIENIDEHSFELELRTNPQRKARFLARGRCTVVSFLDTTKVQFDVEFGPDLSNRDIVSIRCPLPHQAFQIQRRSAYRVRPPLGQSGQVVIRAEPGSETAFDLMDISATGLSLHRTARHPEFSLGNLHQHARVEIGVRAPVPCTLEIKTILRLEHVPGLPSSWRIGCAFINLPPEVQRQLQAHVQDVERILIRLNKAD